MANKTVKKEILQFVPKAMEYLTKEKKMEYNGKILKTAFLIDLTHKLICKTLFKNKNKKTLSEFPLSSKILRTVYGQHYNFYVNWLQDNNLLIKTRNHCELKYSSQYKLNSDIFNHPLIRYKNSDYTVLRKWVKSYMNINVSTNNKTKSSIPVNVKTSLIEDLQHIELDYEKALEYLETERESGRIDDMAYWKNRISIDSINSSDLFHVEDNYGRFHTNFTILKKNIRNNFLTIGGENLMELDIKSSQPLFLSICLKKDGFDLRYTNEYKSYLKDVKDGDIYGKLGDLMGISRTDCKKQTFKLFFGKNSGKTKREKSFRALYPNIYQWIVDIKRLKNNYKHLAWELQKMESELIFDKICNRIKNEITEDVKLFTVHDSIFFKEKYEKEVSEIFNEEVNLILGV